MNMNEKQIVIIFSRRRCRIYGAYTTEQHVGGKTEIAKGETLFFFRDSPNLKIWNARHATDLFLPQATRQTAVREIAKLATNLTTRITHPVRDLDFPGPHLHPALDNHVDDIDHTKSRTTQGAENRHGGNRPEDEFEIEVVAHVFGVVGFAHRHSQDSVGNHPDYDHVGPYGAVVVLLLLGFADAFLGDFESVTQVAQSFVVAGVDIELFRRHL